MNLKRSFSRYAFFLIASSFFLIIPPNAGSDELWTARSSWYLIENPSHLFLKSNIISYKFPGSLSIQGETIGEGIPYPCFFEKVSLPSSCQSLLSDTSQVTAQFDRVFRSPIFNYFVGMGMKVNILNNVYWSGKLSAFILNMLLIFYTIRILKVSVFSENFLLQSLSIASLPLLMYSLGNISPISFEICCGFLFVAILLSTSDFAEEIPIKQKLLLISSGLLLALSRPLGAFWGVALILFLANFMKMRWSVLKYSIFALLLGLIVHTQIDNSSWRFGNGERYEVDTNLGFYAEEVVRVLINSGNWIRQIYAVWTFGAAPELPIALFLVSFGISAFLVYWTCVDSANKLKIFLSLMFGALVLPFLFSVAFSGQWPMWWSGRYQMPFLLPAIFIMAIFLNPRRRRILCFISLVPLMYYSLLVFSRFNWGLYDNGTPIVINGMNFSSIVVTLWLTLTLFWLLVYALGLSISREVDSDAKT
jgi:hypothetical protein